MFVISAERIRSHVDALTDAGPRFEDDPGVAAALTYISGTLREAGLPVEVQRYGSELFEVNLVAELPGRDRHAPLLDVCAHWDTVSGTVGADDNASGVAGVLEVAAVLAGADAPGRGLRFCLFGGEECDPNPFQGSSAHVKAIGDRQVEGAVVLEMIGYRATAPGSQAAPPGFDDFVEYPDTGDFVAVIGNEDSADYVGALAEAAGREPALALLPLLLPDAALSMVSRSDHVPYWRSGRKAVMVTDTADYRNPHYHQPGDVASTLDYDFAAQVATAVATMAHALVPR